MPHTPEHIEEPQVQGDPQVVDFNQVFEDFYNEGLDFKVARRRLRRYEDGKSQFGALEEFYNNKKKSPVRRRILRNLPQIRISKLKSRLEIRILLP